MFIWKIVIRNGKTYDYVLSVIWQKGESQNGGNKNTKHAKFSQKRTFFAHWYAHVLSFYYMSPFLKFSVTIKSFRYYGQSCYFPTTFSIHFNFFNCEERYILCSNCPFFLMLTSIFSSILFTRTSIMSLVFLLIFFHQI